MEVRRVCLTRALYWELVGSWLDCARCPLRGNCDFEGKDEVLKQ